MFCRRLSFSYSGHSFPFSGIGPAGRGVFIRDLAAGTRGFPSPHCRFVGRIPTPLYDMQGGCSFCAKGLTSRKLCAMM